MDDYENRAYKKNKYETSQGFPKIKIPLYDVNRIPEKSIKIKKRTSSYFWIYQPVIVSSSIFSLVGFVSRLTTIMAITATTNA